MKKNQLKKLVYIERAVSNDAKKRKKLENKTRK